MILKYVYDEKIYCTYYDDIGAFLKEYYTPKFKDKFDKSKDIIVLENNGESISYNNMKDFYIKCVNEVYNVKV